LVSKVITVAAFTPLKVKRYQSLLSVTNGRAASKVVEGMLSGKMTVIADMAWCWSTHSECHAGDGACRACGTTWDTAKLLRHGWERAVGGLTTVFDFIN
jgi:hypothetical protein